MIPIRQEESSVRYNATVRNGNANPSFAADSADSICLRFKGTCFLAYFPPNHMISNTTDDIGNEKHTNYSGGYDRIGWS